MPKLIPSLNGLRAFSIFCVLFAHIQIISFHLPDGPGGQIGVNIFFVISGFLITYLLLQEEAATGTISLKDFFIRRSLRIFPAFYFMLLVYFVLQLFGILHIEAGSWLSTGTYTKYLFAKNDHDWETAHTWSLAAEEHFYLVWPCIFLILKKYRQLFALAIIIVVPFVRLYSGYSVMHLFTRADALMWGCFFALHYPVIVERIKAGPAILKLLPFVLILFCLVSKKLIPGAHTNFREHFILAFFGSFGTLTDVGIALLIIVSIHSPGTLYYSVLNSRPMNYIGKMSYSIYLWQQLFFSENMGVFSSFPFNLVCIAIAALISYYGIEKPFLKVKEYFTVRQVNKTMRANKSILQPADTVARS